MFDKLLLNVGFKWNEKVFVDLLNFCIYFKCFKIVLLKVKNIMNILFFESNYIEIWGIKGKNFEKI